MRTLTLLLVLGYAATCVCAGLFGIFLPHLEMARLYHLSPAQVPGLDAADLLSQFRFLKAMELGAGLFMFARLGAIMEGGPERRLFAFIVAAGILARLLAWAIDGPPSLLFAGFLAAEFLVLAAVLAEGRGARGG